MTTISWRVRLGIALVISSLLLFAAHYLIFHDWHHLAIFTVHDLAFVPIEVLIVTLILHAMLERRERREMLDKLNMIIGVFFSEAGAELLRRISAFDSCVEVREEFLVSPQWDKARFAAARKEIAAYDFGVDASLSDLEGLRDFLLQRREFFVRLMENPNLLQHESFTDVLWAVFHLTEELQHRERFSDLPESDLEHLSGDLKRAYAALAVEWISYVEHLKSAYPYLFSLAIRRNPLDHEASVTVTS